MLAKHNRNSCFCGRVFPSPLAKIAGSSTQAPLSQAAASSPGRQELPRAPGCQQQEKSLFSPCLQPWPCCHTQLEQKILFSQTPGGSPSTCRILKAEATCAPIQCCTLTSPFKVAGSLISLRLGSVDQNNKQVIITVFFLYVL